MLSEMLADRLKTEEKCNKELARRQDEYERHLKEVPALLLLTVALWLSLWLEHRALALLVLSALVLTVLAVTVLLSLWPCWFSLCWLSLWLSHCAPEHNVCGS